ncbi:hypothetical protein GCM10011425_20020 [Mucilaginibacter galii]|uniref:MobA/VirD2-like nuclease domain-containing protein n=2 Tax=Mucilaginibacter galii TaxID=2005073 RepID=A0A917JAB2_9SPHI|nr:hypothetical protein GCM10011425_20020 [Mucilaginibacter galii]
MGALKYNWNKLMHPDPNLRAKLLSTNFTSMDLAMIKLEVDLVRSLRPKLNRYVYHTSLNFHKDDVLDNKTLLAIAEDYLRLSGYTSNQYFIFRHHDADHPHLHLLVNRITFDGEVVSDSNNYKKSDAIAVQLEQQYNLVRVKHRIHVPVELSSHISEHQDSRITVEQDSTLGDEQHNRITTEQGNFITGEQYTSVTADRGNNVPVEQGNAVPHDQDSGITVEPDSKVPKLQYNRSPLRAPTNNELEMVKRTRKGSDKMVLQDKLLRLVSKPGISLQDFINKCNAEGIHLLFNQASTGRVSGITYFHGEFKIKGQALGNRFKWAELIKTVDYEQGRDGQAIRQANERTRNKYGDETAASLAAFTTELDNNERSPTDATGRLYGPTSTAGADRRDAARSDEAAYSNEARTDGSADAIPENAEVDNGTGRYNDWRDSGVGYIPDIEISDDIDDEAILGRNRRRQKQARTNTR